MSKYPAYISDGSVGLEKTNRKEAAKVNMHLHVCPAERIREQVRIHT